MKKDRGKANVPKITAFDIDRLFVNRIVALRLPFENTIYAVMSDGIHPAVMTLTEI